MLAFTYLFGLSLLPRQFHQEKNGSGPRSLNYIALAPSPSPMMASMKGDEEENEVYQARNESGIFGIGNDSDTDLPEKDVVAEPLLPKAQVVTV
jgi:hypothetical protein